MINKQEGAHGLINTGMLILFLSGALLYLLREEAFSAFWPASETTALRAIGLVLCVDILLSLSPLTFLLQPLAILTLGMASAKAAQFILIQPLAGQNASRLLFLLVSVPLCFALGGRGLWNALLLVKALRRDRCGLDCSLRRTCVLVLFGMAALWLLYRILRFP